MQRGTRESISVWQADKQREPSSSPLRQNISVDVCIAGAGIAGLRQDILLCDDSVWNEYN